MYHPTQVAASAGACRVEAMASNRQLSEKMMKQEPSPWFLQFSFLLFFTRPR